MPITKNGYFNDPAIAQAVGGIAEMFAPPSAQDQYAAVKTAETQQKMTALAEMYRAANDPNISREQRENAAIAFGTYAPNQSFYAVDQGNLTSRQNNTADNTTKITTTGMQEQGQTTRAMLEPVAAGATRFVPPDVASMFKVDDLQRGNVVLSPGETATLPGQNGVGGMTLAGAPKPLTAEEVKGSIIAGLSPEEQRAVGIGNTPVQNVVGPDGKPVIKFQADAVDMTPAADPSKITGTEGDIRKEILNLPSYKNYAQALPIYQSMLETAGTDSRASDLNMVYGLGKIMDPTSVVREGEMIMVKNTASLPDWVVGAINQVNGKAGLLPETREAIMKEAYSRAKAYEDALGTDLEFYKGITTRNGIDDRNVIPSTKPFVPYQPGGNLPIVNTPEEAAKLPPGTSFQTPDGRVKVVPNAAQ
jgi:hypothetical protein